jgi:hypothetical protein
LPEIFLAELSGNNIKVHAAEVGAEGQKVLEQRESTSSTMQGDVESGSRLTVVAGDGRILVAGKYSTVRHWVVLTDESIWLGGDSRRVTGGREEVYSDGGEIRRTRLPAKVDRPRLDS